MGKRASSPTGASAQKSASAPSAAERTKTDEEGMGEFEDQWEDELAADEDEGEVIDAAEEDDVVGELGEDGLEAGGMDIDEPDAIEEEERAPSPIPFLPTGVLAEGEFLEPDLSTYPLLHSFVPTWPSLSFDILRDNGGEERRGYPVSCALVAGTQAQDRTANEVTVMRWEGLGKTRKDGGGELRLPGLGSGGASRGGRRRGRPLRELGRGWRDAGTRMARYWDAQMFDPQAKHCQTRTDPSPLQTPTRTTLTMRRTTTLSSTSALSLTKAA